MQTRTKVIIAAGLAVALGGAALAGTTQARGSKDGQGHHYGQQAGYGHGGYHGGRHGKHKRGRRLERLLDAYDTNGDGKLTQAEIDQARAGRFADFDTNGDGKLSLEEYEALWMDAMRERMVDRFQSLDNDGDAAVTSEEFGKPTRRIVQRMDRNEDGEISRDDFKRKGHKGRRSGAEEN